jgi:hypothetical protein
MKNTAHLVVSSAMIMIGGHSLAASTYQEDVAFLKKPTEIIELASGSARIAVAPAWQGRVMTSTASGPDGVGFGWINPEVVAAGIQPEADREGLARHIHVFSGEERLWFDPEGGPFALFFPPKVEQTFANWKTPAVIDTEAFETAPTNSSNSTTFVKSTSSLARHLVTPR